MVNTKMKPTANSMGVNPESSGWRKSGDGVASFPGIMIRGSTGVTVDGIVITSPVGYLVFGGASNDIRVRNIKAFNHHQWGDGIDFMACRDVHIDDVRLGHGDTPPRRLAAEAATPQDWSEPPLS